MTSPPTLISLLADGEWHSGSDLAARLGVTRATVSVRIGKLAELGLSVYSVVGRGYRLAQPGDFLAAESIRGALAADARSRIDDIQVFETIDSTNNVLDRIDDGSTRIALAESQTAGRGRTERRWITQFGCNLHLSLIHRLREPQAPLTALTPIIGVELARVLADPDLTGIGLKWPNDLMLDGAKVGGILVDYRGEAGGDTRLIVGVGINVTMASEMAADIDQPWTTLAHHAASPPARNELAARATGAVMSALDRFATGDNDHLADEWQAYDTLADQAVTTIGSNAPPSGVARGVNADGSLRIESEGRVSRVYSGDVRVRKTP